MKTKIISIILIVLLSASCRNKEMKTTPDEAVRVKVKEVTSSSISLPVHTTGILISSEELKLSFKTGGIVAKIYVKEGDRVRKGDLLASLNLLEIKASADQAESAYEKAERDFKRADNLFKDSVATLEQKQNAATVLKMAESTLNIVRFNLTHSSITAPDNGLILKQFVKTNELVSSGYPVILFGSSGKYWKVKASLSDKDIVKINPGDSASVSVDAYPGKSFSAIVDQVGEISNPYTGTYETELILQATDLRLASGFVAGVDIFPGAKQSYLLIPVGSVVEADGSQGYIYTVTEAMSALKIKIRILSFIGTMVAVEGLPEGVTEVVSEGAAYLKDGLKVKVIE